MVLCKIEGMQLYPKVTSQQTNTYSMTAIETVEKVFYLFIFLSLQFLYFRFYFKFFILKVSWF